MTTTRFVSPSTGLPIQAVLFDTFGSVVDWRTGVSDAVKTALRQEEARPDPIVFADAWRAKYEPSMEPIRSGSRPYVSLTHLHRENLRATLAEFDIHGHSTDEDVEWLNRSWERLDPWADSIAGIERLRETYIVGPLSNANTALLTRMAKHARLPWDVIVGSDVVQQYKPRLEMYQRIAAVLELHPGEVMLAAAHNADLASAQQAGLATGFISRPHEFGPGQSTDLRATGPWDVDVDNIIALADALKPSLSSRKAAGNARSANAPVNSGKEGHLT